MSLSVTCSIVGTLSKSAGDPELCGAIDTSEGRAATQRDCPGLRGHKLAPCTGSPAPNGPLGRIGSSVVREGIVPLCSPP